MLNISKYVKNLLSSLDNSGITEIMEQSLVNLNNTQALYTAVGDKTNKANLTTLKTSEGKKLSANYFRTVGRRDNSVLVLDINKKLPKLIEVGNGLSNIIKKEFPRTIFTHAITNKQAVIIRAVEHFNFISTLSADLLFYLANAEDKSLDTLTPAFKERINKQVLIFSNLLTIYSDVQILEKIVNAIDVIITDENVGLIESLHKQEEIDPVGQVTSGFFNPIFSIRMIYTEYQVAKYKENKELVKTTNLRLRHLEGRRNGEENAVLEKEIAFNQKELERLQYDINKMEKN